MQISETSSGRVVRRCGAFFVLLVLAVGFMPGLAAGQSTREPMAKKEVIDLLQSGVPAPRIEDLVRQYGVAFEMTQSTEGELRKAGATDALIETLRQLTSRPAAGASKKLTVENIMELLSGGVPVPRIIHLVQERGVEFQLNPKLEQAFVDAGADQTLITTLRKQSGARLAGRSTGTTGADHTKAESHASGPAVPMPGTAGLRIKSRPGNVTIYVDGEAKGTTDAEDGRLEVAALKPGKHQLRASLAGYQDLEGTVELSAGQVLETPVYLAKLEVETPKTATTTSLPAGKKFAVRHQHVALAGVGGPGYCQGWMIVNVGYVRYISTDTPHNYLMNTSEIRDVKAGGGIGGFNVRLDFGRKYQFVAVDEKGKEVPPGPVIAEIRYSMGQ